MRRATRAAAGQGRAERGRRGKEKGTGQGRQLSHLRETFFFETASKPTHSTFACQMRAQRRAESVLWACVEGRPTDLDTGALENEQRRGGATESASEPWKEGGDERQLTQAGSLPSHWTRRHVRVGERRGQPETKGRGRRRARSRPSPGETRGRGERVSENKGLDSPCSSCSGTSRTPRWPSRQDASRRLRLGDG